MHPATDYGDDLHHDTEPTNPGRIFMHLDPDEVELILARRRQEIADLEEAAIEARELQN